MAKVLVIGSGVTGLTTALAALRLGHEVTIVYKEHWRDTVSAVAAAIWFPFSAEPQDRVNAWSKETYNVFADLAAKGPHTGVFMTDFLVLIEDPDYVYWESALPDGSITPAEPEWILPGYADAYYARVPMSDSSVYMPYLEAECIRLGAHFEQRTVTDLRSECDHADWVINCSGLGAKKLCDDQNVYPIRGQVIRLEKSDQPIQSLIDEHMPQRLAYVLPRTNDIVLGGTAVPHADSTEEDPKVTQKILDLCAARIPELAELPVAEVRVGLRPGRHEVRLEKDPNHPIIHNYGHGGSGYTISWGCAREAVELIETACPFGLALGPEKPGGLSLLAFGARSSGSRKL